MAQYIKYKSYTLANFRQIAQLEYLSEEQKFDIEVVGNVLPFKTNNYVINELINWESPFSDPIFVLTFPQKEMLEPHHFEQVANLLKSGADKATLTETVNKIRQQLNPHPAGQIDYNVPEIDGLRIPGLQHKYRETLLFFPSHGQTCYAYCTFCFRWPQFVGVDEWKFAMTETETLVEYLKLHTEITDILFTGGDPLIMSAKRLALYIEPLLSPELAHLQTIRIGTKALGYWPFKFTTDDDAQELLQLFEQIVKSGKNLSIMAHFNHPVELSTNVVKQAIANVIATGAQIRSQSPVMKFINDTPEIWAEMWRKLVNLNCIPYYFFIARDTGAQHYFAVPLVKTWDIFRKAYQQVSGVCRTVRGPSMSSTPGKIQILGVVELPFNGEKKNYFALRFIQGRNPDWVGRPFFAEYDENAIWLDDLKPAFGETKFFFEDEFEEKYHKR